MKDIFGNEFKSTTIKTNKLQPNVPPSFMISKNQNKIPSTITERAIQQMQQPTQQPTQQVIKQEIPQKQIEKMKSTAPRLKSTNQAVKELKQILNFTKELGLETIRQGGIVSDYALANLPSSLLKFYANNNDKLPKSLQIPFSKEEINASFEPRKLSEGGAADYISTGLGYALGAYGGGNAAKALTVKEGLTAGRTGSLTPKFKELSSTKTRILDSIKEGAKAEAVYSAAQAAGKSILTPEDYSSAQGLKDIAFNLGVGAVGNAVLKEVEVALAKRIAKGEIKKSDIDKVRQEILNKKLEEQNIKKLPISEEVIPKTTQVTPIVQEAPINLPETSVIPETPVIPKSTIPTETISTVSKKSTKKDNLMPKDYFFRVGQKIEKLKPGRGTTPYKYKVLEKLYYIDNEGKPKKYYKVEGDEGIRYIKEFEDKIYNDLNFIQKTKENIPTPIKTEIPIQNKLSKKQISLLTDKELQKQIDVVKSKGKDYTPDNWENELFVESQKRLTELSKKQYNDLEKSVVAYQKSIPQEPISYQKNDIINHKKFGEGKVKEIIKNDKEKILKVEFDDSTRNLIENFSPIILVKRGKKQGEFSKQLDNALDLNLTKIEEAKLNPGTKLYSSLIPLPSKLQQLYIQRGALYIAKGVVDFGEWSSLMIKDLGDSIKPYLKKLFDESKKQSKEIISNIQESNKAIIKSERLRVSAKGKIKQTKVPLTIEKKSFVSKELTDKSKKEYAQLGNKETLDVVQNDLIKNGIDAEFKKLLLSNEPSAYNTVMTGRLIDEFQKRADDLRRQGKFDEAKSINEDIVNLMDILRDKLNNAGQATQAMALYNRLDENGILLFAEKQINKLNKQKNTTTKLNPDEIQNLTDIATSMRKSTNVERMGNRVLDIIDESKTRDLSDSEIKEVADFVNDSNVFIKETLTGTNKYKSEGYTANIDDAELPKEMSNPNTNKEIKDFFTKHEIESKKILKNAEKQSSMTPLDLYSDYVVIGASKIVNGTKNFEKWSSAMTTELGDSITPYLKDIFSSSKKAIKNTTEKIVDPDVKRVMKYINDLLKRSKLNPSDYQEAKDMAKEITKLSGDSKQEALDDLEIFLNSKFKANVGQRISAFQRIMQLLNPVTINRNAIGNELFYRAERLNKYLSTPIDFVNSKLTGKERTVTFKKYNQESYWKNFIKGAKAGWKGTTLQYNLNTQFDLDRVALQDVKFLKYLEKALGVVLYSFDYAAYRRAYNDVISEAATLNAINNKINLNKMSKTNKNDYYENYFRNADASIKELADKYGRYITFQDDNAISLILQKSKRGLNKLSPIKDFGIGNLVINYPKTPGALLTRALEYSPAGILRSMYHLALYITKNSKTPTSRKATEDLSRALFGTTGLTALGWMALENGILLPSRDKDYDKAELNRQSGILGNQINFSALKRFVESGFKEKTITPKQNDVLITYDWAQPLALSIALGSSAANSLKEKEKEGNSISGYAKTAFDTLTTGTLGGVETITQQPVLQNLQNLLTFYPSNLTKQLLIEKPLEILSTLPASFVPTAMNQTRKILDNSVRETYDPNWLSASMNKAIAKVPFASKVLPQKFDTLGNLKKSFQESSIKNKIGKTSLDSVNVFLNPAFVTKYNPTPEASFVLDLIDKTNKNNLAPRLVTDKNIKLAKVGNIQPPDLVLSGKQYAELQKLTGEKVRLVIPQLKDVNRSNEEKAKILEDILSQSYKLSKIEILKKYRNEFTKQLNK